eukprot:3815912-Pleurochrysis_carterae.AAC.1
MANSAQPLDCSLRSVACSGADSRSLSSLRLFTADCAEKGTACGSTTGEGTASDAAGAVGWLMGW